MLAAGLSARGHDVRVITYYSGGVHQHELRDAGVPVTSLGKRGRWDFAGPGWRLINTLKKRPPDVLFGYLTTANVISALVKPLVSNLRIVMGVRASNMDLRRYDRASRLVSAVEARLSGAADCVIANSHAGRRAAIDRGFPPGRIDVIENGIDTGLFRPDDNARRELRRTLGVADDAPVIGMVARIDPMKDLETFLDAAAILRSVERRARFVLAGLGAERTNAPFWAGIERRGLADAVHLFGVRSDVHRVYPAFDLATLSSAFGEGFPNAIGEAMACGIPCVATAVGDMEGLIGDCGRIVAPSDPRALAEAWSSVLSLGSDALNELGRKARERIEAMYTTERMIERTESRLMSLVTSGGAAGPGSPA